MITLQTRGLWRCDAACFYRRRVSIQKPQARTTLLYQRLHEYLRPGARYQYNATGARGSISYFAYQGCSWQPSPDQPAGGRDEVLLRSLLHI
jgi:hypothetical protein